MNWLRRTNKLIKKVSRRKGASGFSLGDKPWFWRGIAVFFLISTPSFLWFKGYPQSLWNTMVEQAVQWTGQNGYALQDLYVEGRMHAPHDQMLRAIGLSRGDAILQFTPQELKERLERISWIEEASIRRRLPGALYIKIRERQPIAFWQHKQQHFLVDSQGVILSCDNTKLFEGLPLIVGEDAPLHAPRLIKNLSVYPDIRESVTALVRVGGRRWDLHLHQKMQVKLPEGSVDAALSRLSTLLKNHKINPKELAIVDLRLPDKMIMRLSPVSSVQLMGKGKET